MKPRTRKAEAKRERDPIDPLKFTTVAHRDHVFCNPLGSDKADRLLALLDLQPGDRVVDVGCGKAEMLVRLIERRQVIGVGVDTNPRFLAVARTKAAMRVPAESLELHEGAAKDLPIEPGSFAAALCVGSTHAFDGYRPTLRALARSVRPAGQLLVGEGFWKRTPEAGYLAALGAKRDDFTDHAGNVAAAVEEGLMPLYSAVSSEDDWDHYEGLYARAIERFAIENPDDPDRAAMIKRIRKWREAYLRWGRDTLGFGVYLFQK